MFDSAIFIIRLGESSKSRNIIVKIRGNKIKNQVDNIAAIYLRRGGYKTVIYLIKFVSVIVSFCGRP